MCSDLDNSDANERLKFSVLKRLPQVRLCVCAVTYKVFMQGQEEVRLVCLNRELLKSAFNLFFLKINTSVKSGIRMTEDRAKSVRDRSGFLSPDGV